MFRKNSGIEKFQAKEGGSFTVLSNFLFISQDRKNFARELFVFQKNSGREKYFMDKRGGITIFHRSFCHTVPKTFVREFYCF